MLDDQPENNLSTELNARSNFDINSATSPSLNNNNVTATNSVANTNAPSMDYFSVSTVPSSVLRNEAIENATEYGTLSYPIRSPVLNHPGVTTENLPEIPGVDSASSSSNTRSTVQPIPSPPARVNTPRVSARVHTPSAAVVQTPPVSRRINVATPARAPARSPSLASLPDSGFTRASVSTYASPSVPEPIPRPETVPSPPPPLRRQQRRARTKPNPWYSDTYDMCNVGPGHFNHGHVVQPEPPN